MIRLLILTIQRILQARWLTGTFTIQECLTLNGDPYLTIDYQHSRVRLNWLQQFLNELQTRDAQGLGVNMSYQLLRGEMWVFFHLQPTD